MRSESGLFDFGFQSGAIRLRIPSGAIGFKAVQRSVLCTSRRELSHEYLLFKFANFGFDTAENGPSKVWRYAPPPPPPQGSTGAISAAQVTESTTIIMGMWMMYTAMILWRTTLILAAKAAAIAIRAVFMVLWGEGSLGGR